MSGSSVDFTVGMRVRPSALGRQVYGQFISPGEVTAVGPFTVTVRYDSDGKERHHTQNVWEVARQEPSSRRMVATTTSYEVRVDQELLHPVNTADLGARHGERTVNYAYHREHSPNRLAFESAAWSAHLFVLVKRSEERDRAADPSVGWDPYGDEP